MTELYLSIAGIPIRISASEFGPLDAVEGYVTASCEPDHSLRAELVEQLPEPEGELCCEEAALRVYRTEDRLLRYLGGDPGTTDNAYLCTIRRGTDGMILMRRDKMPRGITARQMLNALDLPRMLIEHEGFLLHASFISWQGGAILFTAPSETGKSTQARLWCDHAGAELVNGDRAGVRIVDGQVLACGTPFSGSSPVRRNVMLPLRAIVCLSQAPENTIARLRGVRAFCRVWEGCTVGTWDREAVERASMTLSRVLGQIPVYHLACTPDIRAVKLLKHTMEVPL